MPLAMARSGDYDDDDLWAELDALLARPGSAGDQPPADIAAFAEFATNTLLKSIADILIPGSARLIDKFDFVNTMDLDEAYLNAGQVVAGVDRKKVVDAANKTALNPEA